MTSITLIVEGSNGMTVKTFGVFVVSQIESGQVRIATERDHENTPSIL